MMKERKRNNSSFVTMILPLLVLIALFLVILFIQRGYVEEKNITPKESIRLSTLSPAIITETETELNKRLSNSKIKSLFYRARIQDYEIYVFLYREQWRDLSLNEKADAIAEIVQVCKNIPEEISGIPIGLNHQKPQIHIYDSDFERELALWTREGAAIIN